MKKLFLTMSVLFIINCSKKDTTDTSSMKNDSLVSDSTAAIPNPAPQTDSTTASRPANSLGDSTASMSSGRKDSAR